MGLKILEYRKMMKILNKLKTFHILIKLFNELIIWGLVNYPELSKYFIHDTKIYGTKVSFDRDVFKDLSPKDNIDFMLLKDLLEVKTFQ